MLKKGWHHSRVIGKYAKEYNVTDVIVISIISYLPFLPLFLNKNIRFSGIVYRIYLYEWKEKKKKKKIQDAFKYWIMSRCKVFHRVFMCNDSASAQCLNRIFHTNKYRMLPDPVASRVGYRGRNLRAELGIPKDKIVLLHPGGMNDYKNTLGILKAICMLDNESGRRLSFIFAGQVAPSIKKDFSALYKEASLHVQLFLYEGYLPFEDLADLFVTSDYILVPYNVKCQSSGIVGHAAYYGKPVVAMEGGVIGKMVRKWHLGTLLHRPSEDSLYRYLCSLRFSDVFNTIGNHYLEDHTIELFNNTLFESNY